jgi:mono/diheme cytochrome c family protein
MRKARSGQGDPGIRQIKRGLKGDQEMHSAHIKFTLVLMVVAIPFAAAQIKLPPAASRKVDYKQDIQPLLSQNCYSCHGPDVQQAGLRLDLRQNALRGGDYGPVIKIGNSAASKLIHRLVDGDGGLQMPPTGALPNDEIGLLRAWIDQGAEFRTDIVTETAPRPVDPKVMALIAAVRAGNRSEIEKQIAASPDVVRGKDTVPPPSEPDRRFSRIRLSG